jgi:hypothetical protein
MSRAEQYLDAEFRLVDELEKARNLVRVQTRCGIHQAELIREAGELLGNCHCQDGLKLDDWLSRAGVEKNK